MLLRDQVVSPGWTVGTDGVARSGADIILLACRVGLAFLFYFSIQGKLSNMEGFVASLTLRGVPGGMAMGYLAVSVEIIGSLGVLFGLGTRYAALLLVLFVIVATAISHRYWDVPPEQVRMQTTQFYKNVSIISGYLLLFLAGPLFARSFAWEENLKLFRFAASAIWRADRQAARLRAR
jgi:putative oxidoreductase